MMDTETNTLPVWFVITTWAVLSLILNMLGVFAAHPDKPPLALLIAVIGPPALFVIAYSFSSRVRRLSLSGASAKFMPLSAVGQCQGIDGHDGVGAVPR
jgi:hypothetical protein